MKTDAEKEAIGKKIGKKVANTYALKTAAEIEASQNRAKDTRAEMYTDQGYVKAPPVVQLIGHYITQVGKNRLIKQGKATSFKDPNLNIAWAAVPQKDRKKFYLAEATLVMKRKQEWVDAWEANPDKREPKKPKKNKKGEGINVQRRQETSAAFGRKRRKQAGQKLQKI